MSNAKSKNRSCDDCKNGERLYCDGYVYRNWSGSYEGDPNDLPSIPDPNTFWTYLECKKNNKGLKYLNLSDDCSVFASK